MTDWEPIESAEIAPFDKEKWFIDSTPRMLLWIGRAVIGRYSYTQKGKGRWIENGYVCKPTHWMPLPEKPKE